MPYALPQSAPIAISAIEEEYHWVASSKLNCLKRSNSAPFPSQSLQTPIITITSNEESKRVPTSSSTSKPSKSALKVSSCPTSPSLTFHPQSVFPSRGRRIDRHSSRQTRQRSKSFPTLTPPSADLSASESCSSDPPTPPSDSPTSKSVRFPSDGEGKLHCVRFFKKNGRPISVSRPSEESETDYDSAGSSSASGFRYEAPSGFMNLTVPTLTRMRGAKTSFPRQRSDSAPSLPQPSDHEQSPALLSTPNIQHFTKSTLSSYWTSAFEDVEGPSRTTYELDKSTSSPVPSLTFNHDANVHLESLTLDSSRPLFLSGTILVRNVAYNKDVSVRFTLDEWTTISNVNASHVVTLPALPPEFIQAHTLSTTPGPRDLQSAILSSTSVAEWDRFAFTVPLDHFTGDLSSRVLYLAVRYSCGQAEWWDNNGGSNYKIGFRIRSLPEGAAQAAAVSGGEDSKMDNNSRNNLPPDTRRPNGQQNSVESFKSDLHTSPTRSWSSASHSLRCHSASRPYHHDQRPSDVQHDSGAFYAQAQLLKNSYANSRLWSWNCGERGLTRPSHVEVLMSPIRIVSVGGVMS